MTNETKFILLVMTHHTKRIGIDINYNAAVHELTSATVLLIRSIKFSKSTRLKRGCCLRRCSSVANRSSWCFRMEPKRSTTTGRDLVVTAGVRRVHHAHTHARQLPALDGLWLWFSNIWTDSPTKRIFSATLMGT